MTRPEYLDAPYARVFVRDDDGGYSVFVYEWPRCLSCGDTPEEAMAMIEDAMETWASVMLEDGRTLPPPCELSWPETQHIHDRHAQEER